ncbi:hypothetical protein HDU81_002147 [Chytriomyces hyalinus]|nr:hypothetical protein HDU81_002147 [Chytriomyces hyalinus]
MVGTNTKTQDILAGVDLSAFDSIGESILADTTTGKTSAAPSPSVTPQPGPSSSPAPNPVALTEASVPGSRAKSVDKGKVKEKESRGFASFFKTKFLGGLAGANSAGANEGDQTGASAGETVASTRASGKETSTQSGLAQSTTTTTTTTDLAGEQSNGVSLSTVNRSTSVKSIKATSTLARKAAASPDNTDPTTTASSSLAAASSSFMDLGKSAFASLLRKPRSETPVEDDLLDEVPSARRTIPRKPTIPKAEGKTSTRRSAEDLDDNVTVPSLARSPSAMRTLPRQQTSKGQSTSENVNIEDQAKDGIMTLLRSASLKRSVSVKADASAATPQTAAINLASAKAALKAEFNKPSLASLQAELAALRGEEPEPAPWFLAPGKKKGLAAAAAEAASDDASPKAAAAGKSEAAGN